MLFRSWREKSGIYRSQKGELKTLEEFCQTQIARTLSQKSLYFSRKRILGIYGTRSDCYPAFQRIRDCFKKNTRKIKNTLTQFSYPLAIKILFSLYRNFISPLLSPSCRFIPSCSLYAETALKRYGIFKGGILSLSRLLRCNPFFPAGLDLVPEHYPEKLPTSINGGLTR